MNTETVNRYTVICELIKSDGKAVVLLENLINLAIEYMSVVVNNDLMQKTEASMLNGTEYREFVQSLDEKRSRKHNALIAALHAFNRYLLENYENVPIGGIYSLSPDTIHDRVAVGDWAGNLIYEIFVNRKR
jgi:hypothetical protein